MSKIKTFEGLKVRPSYDELINLLDKPDNLKYPDRKASQLRNSHWLSQLDGDSYRAMDELHHNIIKEQEKENILRGYAASHNVSLASLRTHHLAPRAASPQPRAASPPHTANQPQHYNLTPPASPRQQPTTQQQTPPYEPQPFVFPDIQQHYESFSKQRVKQSITRKIQVPKVKKVNNKFKDMHDEKLDEKIEEEQEMKIDDAEMRDKNAQAKKDAMFKEMNLMLVDQSGVKREPEEEASSSSTRPKAKAKTKPSKPDETVPALNYNKKAPEEDHPKSKSQPKKEPEEDHPKPNKTEKIPVKKTIPTKKEVPKQKDVPKVQEEHGTKIVKLSVDEWNKKGRGFLVDQLDLRKINLKKTERIRMNKKDLVAKIIDFDK